LDDDLDWFNGFRVSVWAPSQLVVDDFIDDLGLSDNTEEMLVGTSPGGLVPRAGFEVIRAFSVFGGQLAESLNGGGGF